MKKHVLVASLVISASLSLTGCVVIDNKKNPVNPDQPKPTVIKTDEKADYKGLTVAEAEKLAKKNGVIFRIAEKDGEAQILTADLVPGRINATVKNDTIVSYIVEGQESENTVYDQNSWKTMIAPDCLSFSDGCNTCSRNKAGDEENVACTLMACETYKKPVCLDNQEKNTETGVYDQNSWKTMIAPDCQYFSDGCNTCFRMKDDKENVACTLMACETYEKPVCLDDEMTKIGGITKEEVKSLLQSGGVKSIFQRHNLKVTLTMNDGKKYNFQESKIDEIFELIEECGETCQDIDQMTE